MTAVMTTHRPGELAPTQLLFGPSRGRIRDLGHGTGDA